MRLLLVAVLVALVAVPLLLALARVDRAERRRERRNTAPSVVGSSRPLALTPGGNELERVALDMARAIDAALLDPVYRQGTGWEERARSALRDYYGD